MRIGTRMLRTGRVRGTMIVPSGPTAPSRAIRQPSDPLTSSIGGPSSAVAAPSTVTTRLTGTAIAPSTDTPVTGSFHGCAAVAAPAVTVVIGAALSFSL